VIFLTKANRLRLERKIYVTLAPMRLANLHLEHFRNYTNLDFAFPSEPIVVLSGKNAQGKTNLLEAIYLLSLTKSFRTSSRGFLREFNEDYYRIEAKIRTSDDITLELCELSSPSQKRVLKRNGVKISSQKFIGNLVTVLFRPEDLTMLIGEPSLRRRYLNSILIQTVPGYMRHLHIYQRLLQQRNSILLQAKLKSLSISALNSQLDLWDTQLSEAGSALMTSRKAYTDFLQNQLQQEGGGFEVEYLASEVCAGRLLEALIDARPQDLRSTHTSIGPHRDDMKFRIKKNAGLYPIDTTASRGELRTALMQLKKAEIAWMKEKTGDTPIILLDDIFSELDVTRKNSFMELIPKNAQAIITIAEGNPLPDTKSLRSSATVRTVHAGMLLDAGATNMER